jgi:hypothetical protein
VPSIIQDLTEAFSSWNASQILDPESYPSAHMVLRILPSPNGPRYAEQTQVGPGLDDS